MPALLKLAERAVDTLAVALFLAMFAAICAQVVMRYVFNNPLVWSDEAAQYLFVWIAFLGWVIAARRRSHIAITMVVDRLPPGAAQALRLAAQCAVLGFAAILFWNGTQITADNLDVQMTSMNLGYWMVYLATPLAALFIAIYAVRDIVALLRGRALDGREKLP
jgi:TRAP-type transport system small permease protein